MSETETAMTPLHFSVPVNVKTLPTKGREIRHEATASERRAIASENGLISVEQFTAEAKVRPWKKGGVKLTGRVSATIVQPCAVTLEPIESAVDEEIEMIFVPDGSRLSRPKRDENGELVFDAEGPDLPEPFSGNSIDLAAVWLEFFVLGLDPFLRSPSAELPDALGDVEGGDATTSPFAVLADLKKN